MGNFFLYKNKVKIPPLTMVDDTLGISLCGMKIVQMNIFLNTQTNLMNLQFGYINVKNYILEKGKITTYS